VHYITQRIQVRIKPQRYGFTVDNFGGAVPAPESILAPSGRSSENSGLTFIADPNPNGLRFFTGTVLPLVLLENPRPKGGILTKGERPFSISR
jgi:hypothetical protein